MNFTSLRASGRNSGDWSRSAANYGMGTWAAAAYNLDFGPSSVNSSHGPDLRWNGCPVRCLVILV